MNMHIFYEYIWKSVYWTCHLYTESRYAFIYLLAY